MKHLTENDQLTLENIEDTLKETGWYKAEEDVKAIEKCENFQEVFEYLDYLLWFYTDFEEDLRKEQEGADFISYSQKQFYYAVLFYAKAIADCISYLKETDELTVERREG